MSKLRESPWGPSPLSGGAPLIERNILVYKHSWLIIATGVLEPIFYLLSARVGFSALAPRISGPGGHYISYTAFVAPALLASSSMNGAVNDSTYNFFRKLKFTKIYEIALATPMRPEDVAAGEIAWALIRGALYAATFLLVMLAMGLVHSFWAMLVVPASLLAGFAFAGIGVAATTYMRTWKDCN